MKTTGKFLGLHEQWSYQEFALRSYDVLLINTLLMLTLVKQKESHMCEGITRATKSHSIFFPVEIKLRKKQRLDLDIQKT